MPCGTAGRSRYFRGRTPEGIPAHWPHFSDAAVGFINHLISRNDKGVGISEMPMQQDLLVRVEFDNEIDTVLCFIDLLEDVDDASEQGEDQK